MSKNVRNQCSAVDDCRIKDKRAWKKCIFAHKHSKTFVASVVSTLFKCLVMANNLLARTQTLVCSMFNCLTMANHPLTRTQTFLKSERSWLNEKKCTTANSSFQIYNKPNYRTILHVKHSRGCQLCSQHEQISKLLNISAPQSSTTVIPPCHHTHLPSDPLYRLPSCSQPRRLTPLRRSHSPACCSGFGGVSRAPAAP